MVFFLILCDEYFILTVMKMENLNKTQIVLLTLLTSFVTSIATGIVTVTLMDQAPPGVTKTINRVIERTIETVTPGENKVTTVVKEVVVKEKDLIANAVEKSSKSLVQVSAVDSDGVKILLGLGTVMSGDGYIVTDKDRIAGNRNNIMITYNGKDFPADIVSGENDRVVILKIRTEDISGNKQNNPSNPSEKSKENETAKNLQENKIPEMTPVSLVDSNNVKLGQVVVAFDGDVGDAIQTGIVTRLEKEKTESPDKPVDTTDINKNTNSDNVQSVKTDTKNNKDDNQQQDKQSQEKLSYIVTNININKKSAGGPLFNTDGNIFGINVVSNGGETYSVPINYVKELLFSIINTPNVAKKEGTVDAGNKT